MSGTKITCRLCSLGMHAYPWPDWRARMRGIDPNLCLRCGKERDR